MLALGRARRVDGGRLADDQHRLVRQQPRLRLRIGPRHLVERGREVDIGEALQAPRPRAQSGRPSSARWIIIVPGAWAKSFIARSNRASPVPPVSRASAPGATPAITAREAVSRRPSASSIPGRPPPVVQDARHRRVALHRPAARRDGRDQRPRSWCPPRPGRGPSRSSGSPSLRGRGTAHRPRCRARNRDACPRRRASRAPSSISKVSIQPVARRGQQEPPHVQRAAQALGAKRFKHEICERTYLHRTAQAGRTDAAASAGKSRHEPLPGLGVAGREGARSAPWSRQGRWRRRPMSGPGKTRRSNRRPGRRPAVPLQFMRHMP